MTFSIFNTPTGALAPTGSALDVVAPGIVPMPAAPVMPAAQPGFLSNIWSGITGPFRTAAETFVNAAPEISKSVSQAVGQSLYDIIIQKAGLRPKTQQQADGTMTIQYDKPAPGIPAPLSWIFGGGQTGSVSDAPRGTASTGVSIGLVVALLAAVVIIFLVGV